MRLTALVVALPLAIAATGFAATASAAGPAPIFQASAEIPADTAYQRLYDALEARGYYVIFEPDMGANLARMQAKFGDDYNRNQLTTMKSLVFCNPTKTNQMSNLDPALLALCPLHVTLVHQGSTSTAYFARISTLAAGSPGEAAIREVESEITGIVEGALHGQ